MQGNPQLRQQETFLRHLQMLRRVAGFSAWFPYWLRPASTTYRCDSIPSGSSVLGPNLRECRLQELATHSSRISWRTACPRPSFFSESLQTVITTDAES